MGEPTITNIDLGSVIFHAAEFRDELLTFGGAGTVVEGTILGRITATGALAPFDDGASDGSETPVAILTYDVTATGAGDVPIRAGVAGTYRKERLVIDADGDDSNITNAVLDQLRDYGLVAANVKEHGVLDNQ